MAEENEPSPEKKSNKGEEGWGAIAVGAMLAVAATEANDDLVLSEMCREISVASRQHEARISITSIAVATLSIGVLALMRFSKGADGIDFLLSVVLIAVGCVEGYNTYAYSGHSFLRSITTVVRLWRAVVKSWNPVEEESPGILLRVAGNLLVVLFIAISIWASRVFPRMIRGLIPSMITAVGLVLAIVHYPAFKDLLTHSNSLQAVVRAFK